MGALISQALAVLLKHLVVHGTQEGEEKEGAEGEVEPEMRLTPGDDCKGTREGTGWLGWLGWLLLLIARRRVKMIARRRVIR